MRPIRTFSTARDGTLIVSGADVHTSSQNWRRRGRRSGVHGRLGRGRNRGSGRRGRRLSDRRLRRGGHFLLNFGNEILNGRLGALERPIVRTDQSLAANLGPVLILRTASLGTNLYILKYYRVLRDENNGVRYVRRK